MHRSGTSLTAELCHTLGWPVTGPEDFLRQGNQYNPRGYWETSDLVTINRRILYSLGGDWDVIPRLRPNWPEASTLRPLRNTAQNFIAQIRVPKSTWKDPRQTLTLEFWQPLLPPTRYIVCVRNPLDVARSLNHRDNMTTHKALILWMFYTTQALIKTRDLERLLVFYEDLIGPQAPEHSQRIQRFLDADSTKPLDPVIRSDLSHGLHGLKPLPEETPQSVKDLWQSLLDFRASGFEDDSLVTDIAQSFQPPRTQWATAKKYRFSFWMRYVKMQLLEERR